MRNIGRQRSSIHREAMVLAGDHHAAGVQVLHRMVRAVVAELHLDGARAGGKAEQLVTRGRCRTPGCRSRGISRMASIA
jgi:hypothetical protein